MTMLEMMYVCFDKNGDIKTISTDPVNVSEEYSAITMPLTEVQDFLLGKKNPFDFFVNVTRSSVGFTYRIVRKQSLEINLASTLDNFLTEVKTMPRSADAFLLIENIVKEKKIKISLGQAVKILLIDGYDKDIEAITSFLNYPSISLFFTKKGDPYFLLHTLILSPRELFEKSELFWDYSADLSDSSVYTKKILNGYSYRIK